MVIERWNIKMLSKETQARDQVYHQVCHRIEEEGDQFLPQTNH